MDVIQPVVSGFSNALWVILFILVISIFRFRLVKGIVGEFIVKVRFKLFLDDAEYHQLHNVTLPTLDGTTQIDHIVVSRFGIFVIETKNMQGWIFGAESQPQWTQKIYRTSFKFQNPLHQNYKHLKAVQNTLAIDSDVVHSLVIFVGGASFRTAMPNNVQHGSGAIQFIKSFTDLVLDEERVQKVVDQLESSRLPPDLETHFRHVESMQSRSDFSSERLCPRCGSALVVRKVRSGKKEGEEFWGCTGFPRCRITQKLSKG